MGFHEVGFPVTVGYGTVFAPGYKTSIVSLQSGAEERIQYISTPRHRYEISLRGRHQDDLAAVKRHYVARGGPANGWRLKDWIDYTSNADGHSTPTHLDQATVPTTGDGSNVYFQLVKRYISGSQNVVRTIQKPVSGSVVVSVDNVQQASPSWSYPWSVDTTTGIVTFTTPPPSSEVVRAGYEFEVPVRYDEGADEVLGLSLDSFERGSVTIPVIELFNESTVEDDGCYLGASVVSAASSVSISKLSGQVITFTSTGASSTCTLPPKADVSLGHAIFELHNAGANDLPILDVDDASTVVTLDASGGSKPACILSLGYATGSARKWYALG